MQAERPSGEVTRSRIWPRIGVGVGQLAGLGVGQAQPLDLARQLVAVSGAQKGARASRSAYRSSGVRKASLERVQPPMNRSSSMPLI